MPRYFAFLRAINVGGHTVMMDDLRRHFARLGCQEVETFIASGNVSFCSRATAIPALQKKIESRLRQALGYDVPTFLRTSAQLAGIERFQPFPAAQVQAAHVVNVGFLAGPLAAPATGALLALGNEIDRFRVHGSEVYWLCMTGQNESTVTMAKLERALGAPATFRKVNTISRLVAKYGLA
jgi:uncharacterized protein (DUF1697 family)